MLRVLRHYLPLRKALLIGSETLILTAIVGFGMSWHLLGEVDPEVIATLTLERMQPDHALVRCLLSAFLLSLLAQLTITLNELYDFRVSSSAYDRAARFVVSAGSAIFVGGVAVFLARFWAFDRVLDFPGLRVPTQLIETLVFTLLVGFVALYFWRYLFHFVLARWHFSERVLILGSGAAARALAQEMVERPYSGYEAVAMVPEDALEEAAAPARSVRGSGRARGPQLLPPHDDDEAVDEELEAVAAPVMARNGGLRSAQLVTAPRLEVLSPPRTRTARLEQDLERSESLFDLVRRLEIDLVAVALQDRRRRLPVDDLLRCRLDGIGVKESEEIYERITGKISVAALRPSFLIFNEGFGRSPWKELAKRVLDIVCAAALLFVTWPVMLAAALLVKLDSPGPALFRQERIGRDGKPFTLMKFRSMREDAEEISGPVWAQAGDPRITKVGRFLRKSRLDELPQLFNVLAGHMSLVGPRPEREVFVKDLTQQIPYYDQRHIVKPGLTGWAQINYPYGNTVEDARQKLQYDLFYIKFQSLLFDLSILFNTVKTVLLRKGT